MAMEALVAARVAETVQVMALETEVEMVLAKYRDWETDRKSVG